MSLFLKIFFWFWGAMGILALSLLAVQASSQEDPVIPPKAFMLTALMLYSEQAVGIYETKGQSELNTYLRGIDKRKRAQTYLFSPAGEQLGSSNGDAPFEVREFAAKTSHRPIADTQLSTERIIAAQPVFSRRGTYVFCVAVSRAALSATRVASSTRLLYLAAIGLVTGLFCYGLARFLAAPVGKIRVAAQRLAAGDLSARVAPNRLSRGQDELTLLARDFDKMAARLESLVTAQNRLLGDVSHELRSPLARLNLSLELARRGDEAKREAAFNRIERESVRLDELIRELLTLSRLENGLPVTDLNAPLDVAELAREVAADADFEARGAGRGVRVEYVGAPTGVMTRGDAELLRRAVENLTRNALRHTGADSQVALQLSESNGELILNVCDRGPGVPEAELESIFRPFYRVEGARERAESDRGTGLGLAIADRAVRAHGGHISARNREGGGLCVSITLIAAPQSARELAKAAN